MKEKSTYIKFAIAAIILLCLALPFHWVPSAMKVFKKDKLSFSNTIITGRQIDEFPGKYNDCQVVSQQALMIQDPFYKLLAGHGLIYQNKVVNNMLQ